MREIDQAVALLARTASRHRSVGDRRLADRVQFVRDGIAVGNLTYDLAASDIDAILLEFSREISTVTRTDLLAAKSELEMPRKPSLTEMDRLHQLFDAGA